jgi:hypothetical protein
LIGFNKKYFFKKGKKMLAQNCYGLISLGLWIRTLRNTNDKNTKLWTLNGLKILKTTLESNNFLVSLASSTGSYYGDMERELNNIPNDQDPIGSLLAKKVVEEVTKIEQIVFAEATTKIIYVLPDRRFNTAYLLNDPSKLLKDGIFNKLN